jgi:predicted PurR-regulated permease PerM
MNMQLVALRATVVLGIILLALALWQMREAAQLLAVAIAISAGLAPLVTRLSARGMPRHRAAALVFGGALLALGALAVGFTVLLTADMGQLLENLPLWYVLAKDWMEAQGGLIGELAARLPSSSELTSAALGGDEEAIGGLLLGLSLRAMTLAALFLGAAALGFYWLVDEQRIARLWLSLLPLDARTRVRAIAAAIYREVGIYVRGVAVLALLTTAALLLIYRLAGVPGAAALALLGGLAQVVPLLGPALAVLPGSLIALAKGELVAVTVLGASLAALTAIRVGLGSRLLQRGIGVNPVLVVVVIMALAELGGVPLILLAPPLAAAIQAATRALVSTGRDEAAHTKTTRVAELEQRLEAVAAAAEANPDDRGLQSLVERARALLTEARQAL